MESELGREYSNRVEWYTYSTSYGSCWRWFLMSIEINSWRDSYQNDDMLLIFVFDVSLAIFEILGGSSFGHFDALAWTGNLC